MATKMDTELGKVNISDEVVAIVAGVATTECYGLVGMASRKIQDGIAELLGRDSLSKGVVVKLEDNAVEIDLYIIVEYGVNILEVARNVMDKVRYTVENMLGLKVKDVNVNVQGIRYREKNVTKDGAL
jgi:uncharacterized alkaline shock family protein YloU